METISSPADLRGRVRPALQAGKTIGFVPTMGALHEGHASLIRRARTENDLLVVSVFVNPAQFGPTEDLDRYPRDVPRDTALCEREKVDLLFLPRVADIYPPGFDTFVAPGRAAEGLCGASRPDLFGGAATVVLKLFNIVSPTRAYFGEKDYQQLAVIRQMATDLDLDVEIVPCPTVREADGLAMSSRNAPSFPLAAEKPPPFFPAPCGRSPVRARTENGAFPPCANEASPFSAPSLPSRRNTSRSATPARWTRSRPATDRPSPSSPAGSEACG